MFSAFTSHFYGQLAINVVEVTVSKSSRTLIDKTLRIKILTDTWPYPPDFKQHQ